MKLAKWLGPALLILAGCSSGQDAPKEPQLTADPPSNGASADEGAATTEVERGAAFIKNRKFKDAQEHLQKSIALKPTADAQYYLGVALEGQGDKQGAEDAYKAALKLDSHHADAALNLGAIYLGDPPRPDEAIAVLKGALEKSPDDPAVRQNLAQAYAMKGDADNAGKQYDALLAKGESAELHFAYGAMLFDNKQLDRAAEQLKKAVDGLKDDAPMLVTLGAMLGKTKSFPECVKAYDRAIKLKATDPEALVRRGTCKHELKDEGGAQGDFQQAIKVDTKYALAHYYLALSLLGEKKRAAALKELEAAAALGGDVGKLAKERLEGFAKKK